MADAALWMPLYIGDYLADTMHLTTTQHGAYLLLLMHHWRAGPLPDDDAQLAVIARCDIQAWRKLIGPAVRRFFISGHDGLTQKRLVIERAKASGIVEKRSKAGSTGAARRWSKDGKGNAVANAIATGDDVAIGVATGMPSQWQTDAPSQSPLPKKEEAASSLSQTARATCREPEPPRIGGPAHLWIPLGAVEEVDGEMRRRPVVAGFYVDEVAEHVCAAARINPATFRGDWRPLVGWLNDGIDSAAIVSAVRGVAARPGYKPPASLNYFNGAVRD